MGWSRQVGQNQRGRRWRTGLAPPWTSLNCPGANSGGRTGLTATPARGWEPVSVLPRPLKKSQKEEQILCHLLIPTILNLAGDEMCHTYEAVEGDVGGMGHLGVEYSL